MASHPFLKHIIAEFTVAPFKTQTFMWAIGAQILIFSFKDVTCY